MGKISTKPIKYPPKPVLTDNPFSEGKTSKVSGGVRNFWSLLNCFKWFNLSRLNQCAPRGAVSRWLRWILDAGFTRHTSTTRAWHIFLWILLKYCSLDRYINVSIQSKKKKNNLVRLNVIKFDSTFGMDLLKARDKLLQIKCFMLLYL